MSTSTPTRRLSLIPTLLALLAFAPAPGAAQDDMAQEAPISVELAVARDVQDREPVGESDSFPADVGQVYAWVQVLNGAGQAIQVVWTHGEETFNVPLEIGGSPWRTWSSKTIPPEWAGDWTVTVTDSDGNELASRSFTVGG